MENGEDGQVHDYVFEAPLQANSYLAATLTWDRVVELVDTNGNGLYDLGETFNDKGLNNVDLFLMRAEDDDIADSLWSSESQEDSMEHIFLSNSGNGTVQTQGCVPSAGA